MSRSLQRVEPCNGFRIAALALIAWIILSFILVYFQINNYVGFKFLDGLLSKTLNIKWGWAVLLAGAVMILISVGKGKKVGE
jgi:hypothetical protein